MSNINHRIRLKSRPMLFASLLLTGGFLSVSTVNAEQVQNATSLTTSSQPSLVAQSTTNTAADSNAGQINQSTASRQGVTSTLSSQALTTASVASPSQPSPVLANPAPISTSTPTASSSISLEDYKMADATQLAEWVRSNKVTGDQLLTYALETIKATNPELNNVISVREAEARQESANMVDTGQPFYRVPLLVKGLGHSIAGGQNTNGLAFLADQTSKGTSAYVKALQSAGFVVIGQTAFPEMGWINVTNSDLYGVTHNPWNTDSNPGGSSGGSAAAVAEGQVPVASASDGGGSTRIPASWTGLIGLHPTRGILTGNSAATTNNVSHFALTKTMKDTQALFDFLLKDSAKAGLANQALSKDTPIAYTTQTPAGTPISDEAIKAVQEAVAFLESQGYKTVEVNYPVDGQKMMEAYYTIAAKGALSIDFMANQKLGRHLQKEDVELLSWALYQAGKDLTAADLDAAWASVAQMSDQLNQFYAQYPILLSPTTAYSAPAADYHHISDNLKPLLADMSGLSKAEKLNLIYQQWLPAWTLTPFTQLANLTGTPSLSLPTYLTKTGMPLGILFNSAANNDRLLMQLGKIFEENNLFQTLYHHKQLLDESPQVKDTDVPNSDNQAATVKEILSKLPSATYSLNIQTLSSKAEASSQMTSEQKLPSTGDNRTQMSYLLSSLALVTSLTSFVYGRRQKN